MPVYTVTLPNGTRGDAFERAVALTTIGPVVNGVASRIPLPSASVATLISTYTLIQAQFKTNPSDIIARITMTSALGDLRIEQAYLLPDGTLGPALVFRFTVSMTQVAIPLCFWDVQFSGVGIGPTTWIGGSWAIDQDVTHLQVDPLLP